MTRKEFVKLFMLSAISAPICVSKPEMVMTMNTSGKYTVEINWKGGKNDMFVVSSYEISYPPSLIQIKLDTEILIIPIDNIYFVKIQFADQ